MQLSTLQSLDVPDDKKLIAEFELVMPVTLTPSILVYATPIAIGVLADIYAPELTLAPC